MPVLSGNVYSKVLSAIKLKWVVGMLLTGGAMMPDLLYEFLHGAFELLEFSLDLLVEHFFHTDRHTTQIVVFYSMLSMAAFFVYQLFLRLPLWYASCRHHISATGYRVDQAIHEYWRQSTLLGKTRLGLSVMMGGGLMIWILLG